MRDAIGQVFTLQIILAFVILINGYMAYSVNYTRAFRVKNQIINYIEQYEGAENQEGKDKIDAYIAAMNYTAPTELVNKIKNQGNYTDCPNNRWCYKEHVVTTEDADEDRVGKYYTVVTFVNIDIPVINNLVGLGEFLAVSGETKTIYK